MKTYVALSEAFVKLGVDTMFGVMGDGNMHYVAAFEGEFGGRYISAVDERGAVSMADGYARANNTVGLVTVTHGPGLTNTLTSLCEAVCVRTPLVLLTGQTPAALPNHPQVIDIEGFVRPTGAKFRKVRRPESVVDEFCRAMHQASRERLPVVLDIPIDFLLADVESIVSRHTVAELPIVAPDPLALDEALGILASARRPLILAGRGTIYSDAKSEIIRLADLCNAPLATTIPAKGMFDGHRLNIGVCGTFANAIALDAIAESDAIISFGASLNEKTTDNGKLMSGKAVVQCGNDPTRFDTFMRANVLLHGDAAATAKAMADMLEASGFSATTSNEALAQKIADHKLEDEFKDGGGPGSLDQRTAAIHLNRLLPKETAVVCDAGRFLQAAWRYLDAVEAKANVQTNHSGSIGLAMGTAVGFAAARPDLLTIAALGDGGGFMGIKEFSTAVRNNLRVAVVVFNDESYGSEYEKYKQINMDPKYSLTKFPRLADMAEAMGGHGVRVSSLEEIDALGPETWADENLPVLIEIMVDPEIDLFS